MAIVHQTARGPKEQRVKLLFVIDLSIFQGIFVFLGDRLLVYRVIKSESEIQVLWQGIVTTCWCRQETLENSLLLCAVIYRSFTLHMCMEFGKYSFFSTLNADNRQDNRYCCHRIFQKQSAGHFMVGKKDSKHSLFTGILLVNYRANIKKR